MGIATPEDTVTMANGQVLATHALRDDLMAVLFPRGIEAPSELLQSRVRLKLQLLTASIQRAILGQAAAGSQSWKLLSDSGLLREPGLIDFALSRIAEDTIRRNIQSASDISMLGQLPVTLLSNNNERLAEMARKLLHAEQISSANDDQLFQRLDSEALHLLCWRVVAALVECKAADNKTLTLAAKSLLGARDDGANPVAVGRKLVFFLGQEYRAELNDPRISGLPLFVASLDQDYGLGGDFLLRLIAAEHAAPLLLLLKGQGVSDGDASCIIPALRGDDSDSIIPDWKPLYAALDPVEARAAIATWKSGETG